MNDVKVKICGLTNIEDALAAVDFGADALGFVFYKPSPRYVSPQEAEKIVAALPPFVTTVGVFVDMPPEEVEAILQSTCMDIAQFHGDEPPEACICKSRSIKAIRVRKLKDLEPLSLYDVSAYLLDAYSPDMPGGTGTRFNWDIAVEAKKLGRVIIAGGLTADNVAQAVAHVQPYGVDVSSGVEAQKGKKDLARLKRFITQAKAL